MPEKKNESELIEYRTEVDIRNNIKKIGKQQNIDRYKEELTQVGYNWQKPQSQLSERAKFMLDKINQNKPEEAQEQYTGDVTKFNEASGIEEENRYGFQLDEVAVYRMGDQYTDEIVSNISFRGQSRDKVD